MRFLTRPASANTAPLLVGFAPPKLAHSPEETRRIAGLRNRRIARMRPDAIVVYDIQDESSRTDQERPFPYLPTVDPLAYAREHLEQSEVENVPRIIYRAVTRSRPAEVEAFLRSLQPDREATVLVGSPSRSANQVTSLSRAYEIASSLSSAPLLGGVAIPERHEAKENEHLRLARKMGHGCSFFVTQCVYDLQAAKNMLSDYRYHAPQTNGSSARIILTLSPCGSRKTLDLMKWLGVRFPRWLENDLEQSGDILDRSLAECERIAADLAGFCVARSIPFGFNIESVAIRKAEIDAAERLTESVATLLRHHRLRPGE